MNYISDIRKALNDHTLPPTRRIADAAAIAYAAANHRTQLSCQRDSDWLRIAGLGDHSSGLGDGVCVGVDFNQKDNPVLMVYADINKDGPTHTISLAGARHSNREPDDMPVEDIIDGLSSGAWDGDAVTRAKMAAMLRSKVQGVRDAARAANEQIAPSTILPGKDSDHDWGRVKNRLRLALRDMEGPTT